MRLKLHWQILIALALAVAAGAATDQGDSLLGVRVVDVYTFLGTLFLNALKMLIVPLIVSAIITGVAGMGAGGGIGRLGGRTLLYYLLTSLLAILVGLVLVNVVAPGVVGGEPARDVIGLDATRAEVARSVEGDAGDFVDVLLRMVPPNIVAAAVEGQMLGLIVFSILFGYFTARIESRLGEGLLGFWQAVFEVMMRITGFVILFTPLGVFALVANTVASTGFEGFKPLALFFVTVVAALGVHFLVALPLLLLLVGRVHPWRHYRAMAPALLTAFSTASSSATLPLTMECAEENAGVSNRTTSFVLPLGATVNMDGTALYECVAALFIAQAYGLQLGFAEQFIVVFTALLTSVGVAGVPAASLVAITVILSAIGLPMEGVGLILAVDRILDMMRTSVNVFSDSCGAVIVGRLEGEEGILVPRAAA